MKQLPTKITAMPGDYDYITSKVTFCGNGTWLLQEYEKDGRATQGVSCYREEFDISPEEGSANAFNAFCYTPALINPQRNYCASKDKMNSRLKVTTVIGANFSRSGTVGFSLSGERRVTTFRLHPGEYLILSPVIEGG